MPRVVVIGSANVDMTVRLSRLPRAGETVSGGELYRSFGGKGANQAVAALRAGAEVRLLAKLGADSQGRELMAHLEASGLSRRYLLQDPQRPTGTALIMVDDMGRNLIGVAPGANHGLTPEDVLGFPELFEWGQWLLIQLEIPMETVDAALRMARGKGMRTILNPAPVRELSGEMLALVDLITPNEGELLHLVGSEAGDLEEAALRLLEKGPGCVIVTMGERGALGFTGSERIHCPGLKVQAVDTTGCGDAFNGAMACALAEERALAEALVFANSAGALAATRRGAQDSMPWRREIESLLAEQGA